MKLNLLTWILISSVTLTACGGGGSSKPRSSSSSSSSTISSSTVSSSKSSLGTSATSASATSQSSITNSSTTSSIPPASSSLQSSSIPASLSSSSTSSTSSSSSAGAWIELGVISGSGASGAQAVVDASGNALVVWKELDANASTDSLHFSRYVGSAWSSPQLIEQSGGDVDSFKLVNDQQSGRALIIWKQFTSTQYDLWVSMFEPDTGWSTPVNIESKNSAVGDYDLVFDSQKNAIAVWSQLETISAFSIYANRYTSSSGWGAATLIETVNELGRQDGDPRIAKLSGGDAEVVWMKTGTSPRGIWHNKFTTSTGWGQASELITDNSTSFSFDFPRIMSAGDGLAQLFWGYAELSNGTWLSSLKTKAYASGWSQTSQTVGTPDESSSIYKPYGAVASTNKALVVWGGSGESIFATPISNTTFGTVTRIKPVDTLEIYSEPVVAVDAAGNGLITWTQKSVDLLQHQLHLLTYSNSAGWQPAIIIGNQNEPAYDSFVAMNEQGKAILVWTSFMNTQGTKIHARYRP